MRDAGTGATLAGRRPPRRVLHVITSLDRGGAENYVLSFAKRSSRDRYRQEIAYLGGQGELVGEFIAADIPVHYIGARARIDPFALWRLVLLIRENHYDLIHTHLFRADLYGTLAARLAGGIPVVSTRHNDDRFFLNPLIALVHYLVSTQQRSIIAISDHIARFTINCGVDRPEKVRRIYHGLEASAFERQVQRQVIRESLGLPADCFLLASVGRLTDQKGHRFLISALPGICRRIPHARLLLVGTGELELALRALAREIGVGDRVVFAGVRRDIPALLQACDLFVLPSIWEGFGIVLLEAMAARKPIIASRVSTIPEVVVDGETGLLVPPGDVEALVAAVTYLEQHPELARAMAERGRQRLEQHFSIDKMVADTEALYEEILSSCTSTRAGGRAS